MILNRYYGSFTLTETNLGTNSDSYPTPILSIQLGLETEFDSVQCENTAYSNVANGCSPNQNWNPNLAM